MNDRIPYKKRAGNEIVAVQLNLDTQGFTYHKWGNEQTCKPGDWLVLNGRDTYTVDAESFADTYEPVSLGLYRKISVIWARQAKEAGQVKTREGATAYEAGDYLVSNDVDGTDRYAISADRFEDLYEPAHDARQPDRSK